MQYLTGSFITILAIYFALRFLREEPYVKTKDVMYTQSHIYETIKPLLPYADFSIRKKVVSQSYIHEEKTRVKVIILDKQAYWIKDNLFYSADVSNHIIQKETAHVVDTISMDKVQLDKMLFIMDQLRDGEDYDSRGTGH